MNRGSRSDASGQILPELRCCCICQSEHSQLCSERPGLRVPRGPLAPLSNLSQGCCRAPEKVPTGLGGTFPRGMTQGRGLAGLSMPPWSSQNPQKGHLKRGSWHRSSLVCRDGRDFTCSRRRTEPRAGSAPCASRTGAATATQGQVTPAWPRCAELARAFCRCWSSPRPSAQGSLPAASRQPARHGPAHICQTNTLFSLSPGFVQLLGPRDRHSHVRSSVG